MSMSVELTEQQAAQLEARARELGVAVEALFKAVLSDLLSRPVGEIEAAMKKVLDKNSELYRRLS